MFRPFAIALAQPFAQFNAMAFGMVDTIALLARLDFAAHQQSNRSNIAKRQICQPINEQYLGNLIITIIGGFGDLR